MPAPLKRILSGPGAVEVAFPASLPLYKNNSDLSPVPNCLLVITDLDTSSLSPPWSRYVPANTILPPNPPTISLLLFAPI